MGLSNMVPYNVMITAVDFFNHHYGSEIEYYMAVALVLPNLLGLLVNASGILDTTTSESVRVIAPTLAMSVICAFVPFLPHFSDSKPLILFAAGLLGFMSAISQGTLYATTGRCAPKHTAAISSGGAMGGVVVCLIRIATKAFVKSTQVSAIIYFGISCFVLLLSIPVFVHTIHYSPVVKEFMRISSPDILDRAPPTTQSPQQRVIAVGHSFDGSQADGLLATAQRHGRTCGGDAGGMEAGDADDRQLTRVLSSWEVATTQNVPFLMIALFINYMVTLTVFPGLTTQIDTAGAISKSWLSVMLITIFNVCDCIGKSLPLRPRLKRYLHFSPAKLLWISLARIVFVPLFLLAYYKDIPWVPMLAIMVCFGLSNGILGSLTMMSAPSKVNDLSKGKAGSMMVFMLGLGLACGSFTGVGIMQILKRT